MHLRQFWCNLSMFAEFRNLAYKNRQIIDIFSIAPLSPKFSWACFSCQLSKPASFSSQENKNLALNWRQSSFLMVKRGAKCSVFGIFRSHRDWHCFFHLNFWNLRLKTLQFKKRNVKLNENFSTTIFMIPAAECGSLLARQYLGPYFQLLWSLFGPVSEKLWSLFSPF